MTLQPAGADRCDQRRRGAAGAGGKPRAARSAHSAATSPTATPTFGPDLEAGRGPGLDQIMKPTGAGQRADPSHSARRPAEPPSHRVLRAVSEAGVSHVASSCPCACQRLACTQGRPALRSFLASAGAHACAQRGLLREPLLLWRAAAGAAAARIAF